MSDVINNVPRELLQSIERSWRIPEGCPENISEEVGEIIAKGLRELRALLAKPADGWREVPVDSLCRIFAMIDPEPVRLPNGDTMVYKNPNAGAILREISAEFRAMLAAAPKAGDV